MFDPELFPGFPGDPERYQAARSFWRDLVGSVLRDAGTGDDWRTPWLADDPLRDGSPAFSAVCPAQGRGLCIVQYPRGSPEDLELTWWYDTLGDPDWPGEVLIDELVVACILTEATARRAVEVIRPWVMSGERVEEP